MQQNPVNFFGAYFGLSAGDHAPAPAFQTCSIGNCGDPPQGIKEESSSLTLFEIAVRSLDHTQEDVLQKW